MYDIKCDGKLSVTSSRYESRSYHLTLCGVTVEIPEGKAVAILAASLPPKELMWWFNEGNGRENSPEHPEWTVFAVPRRLFGGNVYSPTKEEATRRMLNRLEQAMSNERQQVNINLSRLMKIHSRIERELEDAQHQGDP